MIDINYTPPLAPEIEKAVLGAMLLEKEAVDYCMAILKEDSFYKPQNSLIFKAIEILWKQDIDIDQLSVTQ